MSSISSDNQPQPETGAPRYTGLRYLDFSAEIMPALIGYNYNGASFHVLASTSEKDLPLGYNIYESIEGKILDKLTDLTYDDETPERTQMEKSLIHTLAELTQVACLPLMKELGPSEPLGEATTMQEQIYPPTYTLKILTKDDKLTAHRAPDFQLPDRHPPIKKSKLEEMNLADVPVFEPSQIVLKDRLQSFVWKVTVGGELMICKMTFYVFENAIGNELESYQKIAAAKSNNLRVPKLKGVVRSHTGIIGLLLEYIPHSHHSLRAILKDIEEGTIPETEATPEMRKKWAEQIKTTLSELHAVGVLWRDVKTDNVLIDENGDAIVLDFGGGNTVGWVDEDKYGTMEGEAQGFEKIMKVLGQV